MMNHFLNLSDAGGDALVAMLNDAMDRKAARKGLPKGLPDADAPLAGHVLAMIFEKNSTRTRTSFEMAIRQLGGDPMMMTSDQMQLGRGETIEDTAKVLSRFVDAIMIRTDDHGKIEALAANSDVPVINGLTDQSHPCQIVADLLTILENGKALPGLKVAYFGDGNNVTSSIIEAAGLLKFNVSIASPEGYDPDPAFVAQARENGARIDIVRDAMEAAKDADVIVTDTWVSMGQAHADAKIAAMTPFQVNAAVMAAAKDDAIFLHCLPAHRDEEVTAEVIDGPQSRIWDEAENRLHAQKSVLLWALGKL
jgi:ornithine carbamoyltransferase